MRFLPRLSLWRYYLMFAVVHTIGRMPMSWRYGIARFGTDRIYNWGPNIGKNVRDNVRHVLGPDASDEEVDRVARQCARNTGRYYADVIGMHRMDIKKFWNEDLTIDGLEYLKEAHDAGRGVIIASAHYANPEFAVQGLAAIGIKVFALVEPLEPPQLGKLMRGLRTVHGHIYEPVSFGAIKDALNWLRNGGVSAILIDRDIQKRGIVLDFCGAPARFPTGAVDMAMRTNAMLLPGWVRRTGGFKMYTRLGPPLEMVHTGDREADIRTNTAALLALFEKHLKEDPGQWSVLDRIWPPELQPAAFPAEAPAPK
jgi:phosphatidylinositol dimannoside acyltransferase